LPEEWESIIGPVDKKGDKTDCSFIEAYHLCQLNTKFNPPSCCQG